MYKLPRRQKEDDPAYIDTGCQKCRFACSKVV